MAFALSSAAAAASAGLFQFVVGEVRIVAQSGAERMARKGAVLNVGDTVSTARGATAQVKMGDGAIVVMQPESRLMLSAFHFSGSEDGSERVQWRLEQGGFRSVTGAIGHTHKNNYSIETPIAHMGVRGTDHESYYFAPGSGTEKPGAYNKVNTGITYIRSQGGEVVIAPNQVGYVASSRAAPELLPSVPGFFNHAVAPRSARMNAPEGAPVREATSPAERRQPSEPHEKSLAASQHKPDLPAVVQEVMARNGTNLTNPGSGSASSIETTVAGYSQGSGGSVRTAANAVIAPNGAVLSNAGGDAAWGVDWGSWQGGGLTVSKAAASTVHFAHSTNATSVMQLAALGSAGVSGTYSYLGGPAPTNQAGVQGSVNSLSIGVNFTSQAITSYSLNATTGGQNWQTDPTSGGSFAQFTGASGIGLKGTCTGCTAPAVGTANGAFVGPAAERMITSFGLKSGNASISGTAYLGR